VLPDEFPFTRCFHLRPVMTLPGEFSTLPTNGTPLRALRRLLASWPAAISLAIVFGCLVAAYALWYTSSGHFPTFPEIQNDYVDLGRAFLRGRLSLLEQPDPRLSQLGDPYEYTQRKDIPYHWDASYYEGKYYLYWGPVPALISAAWQAIAGSPPSASLLVVIPFLGLLGSAIVLMLLVSQSFGAAARATVWIFVLVGFFNLPMLFTIGQPRHYQASILFGQFFLLAGALGLVMYSRARRPAWLLVSGTAWGLAFACRYNLAISIAVYLAVAAFWLWRDAGTASASRRLVWLLAPLALCLLGLGLYNLARFHDPLETGMTYQLTIPEFREISYSTAYVPSGLYAYFLYPLTGARAFPFIQSAHFRPGLLPASLFIPDGREFDQIIFGLVPTVPALWLTILAVPLVFGLWTHRRAGLPAPGSDGASPAFVFWMLAAGAAGQIAFLLVFFYIAERYIVDFYVPLIICLAIVVWRFDALLAGRRLLRLALWAVVLSLAAWTAIIGYLACFGVPVLVSIYYDPQMLARLAAFWNETFPAVRLLFHPG
jgi:hypothetical protein